MSTKPEATLIALHNLSAAKLRKLVTFGGIPMPSLAVIPAESAFTRFGPISLIAPLSMVDPAKDRVDRKALDAFLELVGPALKETDERFDEVDVKAKHLSLDAIVSLMSARLAVQLTWLREIGAEVPELPRNKSSLSIGLSNTEAVRTFHKANPTADLKSPEFLAAVKRGLEEQRAIYSARGLPTRLLKTLEQEAFDSDGSFKENALFKFSSDRDLILANKTVLDRFAAYTVLRKWIDAAGRDAFDDWVEEWASRICVQPRIKCGGRMVDYNLDSIMSVMKRMAIRGSEGGIMYSLPRVKMRAAKQYRSIREAAEDTDRIERVIIEENGPDPDYENQEFMALAESLKDKYTTPSSHRRQEFILTDVMDDLAKSLHDYFAAGRTQAAMQKALSVNGFSGYSDADVETLIAFADKLKNQPSKYFEAKIKRAVYLNEFAAAVLPADAPEWVERSIRDAGIQVVERYELSGYGTERADAVRRAARAAGVLAEEKAATYEMACR